jgi:hypothetical protein
LYIPELLFDFTDLLERFLVVTFEALDFAKGVTLAFLELRFEVFEVPFR